MKLITNRFHSILQANPNYTTYLAFANAVLSVTVAPQVVAAAFDQLVDKKDYLPSEKEHVLAHLTKLAVQAR